jgi:hypothetical protein
MHPKQMGDIPPEQNSKEFDITRFIEATIYGLLLLLASIPTTTLAYLFRPRSFQPRLLGDTDTGIIGLRYTRPLTYLFLSLIGCIALFWLLATPLLYPSESGTSQIHDWLVGELSKLDFEGLFLCASPYWIAVALFALSVVWSSRAFGLALTFTKSMAIASYSAGCFGWLYVVFFPLVLPLSSRSYSQFRWLQQVVGLIASFFIFRCAYCYLVLLKRELHCSRWRVISIFLRSVACTLGMFFAMLTFLYPMLKLLVGSSVGLPAK